VASEYTTLDQANAQGPLHDDSQQELAMILPCGTRIFKERTAPPQHLEWPTLYTFDGPAWDKFIVKYRRVFSAALPINVLPIVRCIDPLLHVDICQKIGLVQSKYYSYPNPTMEQKFAHRFGPACASAARDRFGAKHFKFDDSTQHQNTFASVVFRFFQEKMKMLQDFTLVEQSKWDPSDEFTHNMVIDTIVKCFPISPTSSNNETIVQMIKDHRNKTLQQIQSIIDAHFTATDVNVEKGQNTYHSGRLRREPSHCVA
jgi:hypothetical protein